jgi:hypothetical protein
MDTDLGGDFKCGMIMSRIYVYVWGNTLIIKIFIYSFLCSLSKNSNDSSSEQGLKNEKNPADKPVKPIENDFPTVTRFGFLKDHSVFITGLNSVFTKNRLIFIGF